MTKSEIQRIRERRAELMLEDDLWKVVNVHFQKEATKCEAKLTRAAIICVLGQMVSRVASEIQGYR